MAKLGERKQSSEEKKMFMKRFNFTKQDLINWGISVDDTDTGEYIVSAPYIIDYKKGKYVGK